MGRYLDLFIFFLFIVSAALFILYPQIDIAFSALFYEDGFYLADRWWAKAIYKATVYVTALFALGTLVLLLAQTVFKREFLGIKKRVLVYLLAVLITGPGIVVNLVLKNHWDRARPIQCEEFGGKAKFSPAFLISDQCERNCSFTSGHSAAAFYFLALVPLFRKKSHKIVAAAAALTWGGVVSAVRIVQGGHFLSDTIFSAFIVYFTARAFYFLILKREE